MSGWRWTSDEEREIEVSPFGLGWWTAPQLARLGWWCSLIALVAGSVQVMSGNAYAVVAVATGAAGLTLAWLVDALVVPLARRGRGCRSS